MKKNTEKVEKQKDHRGAGLQDLSAHIRLKRQCATRDRDLGAGDAMIQATRRATKRLKDGADYKNSRVARHQLWDPALILSGSRTAAMAVVELAVSDTLKLEIPGLPSTRNCFGFGQQ